MGRMMSQKLSIGLRLMLTNVSNHLETVKEQSGYLSTPLFFPNCKLFKLSFREVFFTEINKNSFVNYISTMTELPEKHVL
jgi:hypothetical protein